MNTPETKRIGNVASDLSIVGDPKKRTRNDKSVSNSPLTLPNLRPAVFFLFLLSYFTVLAGADSTSSAEEELRQGNAAFDRNDFETALNLYQQAEGKFSDPGLLAFNEGAALYRLGRYREAEIHYWLCRQDAVGQRLVRVLYDLGNAVYRQAGDKDKAIFERAIEFYEECLKNPDTDPELAENARHNLALALAALKKTKGAAPNRPEESSPDNKPTDDRNRQSPPNSTGSSPGTEDDTGSGQQVAHGSEHEDLTKSQKPGRRPGVGNLPPIPDSDQLTPLNLNDTAEYLKQAADRILRERRGHYGKSIFRPAQNIKDW
jgi:tetratricopeptide (TPR) repeat protein